MSNNNKKVINLQHPVKASITGIFLQGFLFFIIFFAASCNKEDSPGLMPSGESVSQNDLSSEMKTFASAYINAKYEVLINTDADVNSLNKFNSDISNAGNEVQRIVTLREGLMRKAGIKYTAYKVEITVDSITTSNGMTSFSATEHFILTTNQTDNDDGKAIQPRGYYQHRFSVQEVNGEWKVIKESCDDDPWAFNENPIIGQIPSKDFSTPASITTQMTYYYNAQAAKNYAYQYAYNYNPAYCSYANSGGDCANFLSQILKAGGWIMNSAWTYSSCANRSTSWISAHGFLNYVISSGRIDPACYAPSSLLVGDIVQADWTAVYGNWHNMFITSKSGSNVFLTYHSNNRVDVPFLNLPSAPYYGWHVKSYAN